MSNPSTATVEYQKMNGIASIGLNRPTALNAFNAELRHDLLQLITAASADDTVRVIVLGAKGRAFCAGADLTEVYPDGQTAQDRLEQQYKPLLLSMVEAPKPIIGVLQGATAGIGCALALCCDLLVMAESACFVHAFSAVGLIPDGGLTWQLPRIVGVKKAYEIIALGEKLSARDCLSLGLVNRVVADAELDEQSQRLATQLLAGAPLSLRYAKEALRRAAGLSLADAISAEAELQLLTSSSEDHQEGKAAFREKRKPVWLGR